MGLNNCQNIFRTTDSVTLVRLGAPVLNCNILSALFRLPNDVDFWYFFLKTYYNKILRRIIQNLY